MIRIPYVVVFVLNFFFFTASLTADGKVVPVRNYKGSLEERSQEAIIVITRGDADRPAVEDLILKIRVEGDAEQFAWIIPFPNEPETFKEDPKLFKELFDYVQQRTRQRNRSKSDKKSDGSKSASARGVDVISRKIVGDYEITVVRETESGGLNPWLAKNGYQKLEDQDGVLEFYRLKNYVYACIKVTSEALAKEKTIDSHPLRFRFKTGGVDGIYFPMKLTGLQTKPFDINLYIFNSSWINGELNEFGYRSRGFDLVFRDYDSPQCEANAGKRYSAPDTDEYLAPYAKKLSNVKEFFQRLYPGKRFYLTNIQSKNLKPEQVRLWADDLWVFPYYVDRTFVPFDVRENGPASAAWPDVSIGSIQSVDFTSSSVTSADSRRRIMLSIVVMAGIGVAAMIVTLFIVRAKGNATTSDVNQKPEI